MKNSSVTIIISPVFRFYPGLLDASHPHTCQALTFEQSVNAILINTPIIFSPLNTAIAYDDKQMQLADRVAEVVTVKDWRSIVRELLFDACAIHKTQYNVSGGTSPAVTGRLSTSVTDCLIFLNMIMNNWVC